MNIKAASISRKMTSKKRHSIFRNLFRVRHLNKCKNRQTNAVTQIQYQAFTLKFTPTYWSAYVLMAFLIVAYF
jgi:hypothetical protein